MYSLSPYLNDYYNIGLRYVNDQPLSDKSMLPAAFIEQDVNFFPHMTVKETLDFRVELKLGSRLGKSARDDVVSNLMDMLGLTKSANTIVGSTKVRGLSGGERKRLSIAAELISSPPVIILDEVSMKKARKMFSYFLFYLSNNHHNYIAYEWVGQLSSS